MEDGSEVSMQVRRVSLWLFYAFAYEERGIGTSQPCSDETINPSPLTRMESRGSRGTLRIGSRFLEC